LGHNLAVRYDYACLGGNFVRTTNGGDLNYSSTLNINEIALYYRPATAFEDVPGNIADDVHSLTSLSAPRTETAVGHNLIALFRSSGISLFRQLPYSGNTLLQTFLMLLLGHPRIAQLFIFLARKVVAMSTMCKFFFAAARIQRTNTRWQMCRPKWLAQHLSAAAALFPEKTALITLDSANRMFHLSSKKLIFTNKTKLSCLAGGHLPGKLHNNKIFCDMIGSDIG
jgi:hypothetical protein